MSLENLSNDGGGVHLRRSLLKNLIAHAQQG